MNRKKIMTLLLIASATASPFLLENDTAYASNLNKEGASINNHSKDVHSKGKVINVTTDLRVRSGAGTTYSTIGTLNRGQEFTILSQVGDWYRIDYKNKQGFIHKDYVQVIGESESVKKGKVVNVTNELNVRDAASINSAVIGHLKNGQEFEILDRENQWFKVKSMNTTGYIHSDYVKEIDESNVKKVTEKTKKEINEDKFTENLSKARNVNQGRVINVETALRVRSGPSTNTSIKGYVYNNDTIQILAKSGAWYKIKKGSTEGYVHGDYIRIDKDSTPNVKPENKPSTNSGSSVKGTGKVVNITSSLRIRKGPGTNYSTVGSLRNGDTFNVNGKEGDWYKISKGNINGYVHKDFVSFKAEGQKPENKPEQKPSTNSGSSVKGTGKVVNITSSLRIRKGPGTNYSTVGSLRNGDTFNVSGKEGDWYKISKGSINGYVHKDFVSFKAEEQKPENKPEQKPENKPSNAIKGTGKVVNITSSLRVRKGPGTNYSTVGSLRNGDTFNVSGKEGDWYKISKGSINGYVHKDFVSFKAEEQKPENKPEQKPENKPSNVVSGTGKVVNITSNLRIRKGPGTNYSVVGIMNNGDTFKVNGKEGDWYKISKGSINGYVHKDFVSFKAEEQKPENKPEQKPNQKPENSKKQGIVKVDSTLRIRKEPNTSSAILGQLRNGERVDILGEENGFYKINNGQVTGYASKQYISLTDGSDNSGSNSSIGNPTNGKTIYTSYNMSLKDYISLQQSRVPSYSYNYFEQYINPAKATNNHQFLRIDQYRDINTSGLNSYLQSKNAGVLKGTGAAFASAARQHNIDPIYFVSQSIHETGYGKSTLAKGVRITEIANPDKKIYNSAGKLIGYEMIKLDKPVTVYNLFGIGAYDNSESFPNRALIMGTTYAYKKGWTSIEKAINGAAEFVSLNYVNSSKYEQNTLYKMRYMHRSDYVWHQYATSPWYAQSIGGQMQELSYLYKNKSNFLYDKPKFK